MHSLAAELDRVAGGDSHRRCPLTCYGQLGVARACGVERPWWHTRYPTDTAPESPPYALPSQVTPSAFDIDIPAAGASQLIA